MRTKLFLIISLISTLSVLSQNIGDYRTKATGPNPWNNANSWEVYNGSAWVNATNYPGQIAGAFAVEIRSSHVITIPTSTGFNALMPNQFGTLTVNGQISIAQNQNVYINASVTIVTQNVGTINFLGNADLYFPQNMQFSVFPGGLIPAENNNSCNASKRIYIGSILFSTCNGNGPGDPISFFELMQANGSILSVINAAFADCNAATFNLTLTPSYIGVAGNNTSFAWVIKLPNGSSINSNNNPLILDLNQEGEYEISLKYTTYINGNPISNTRVVFYDNKLTTWNGAWSNGAPTLDARVIINSDYSGDSFSSCFLKINNGATLTIASNKYVEVSGSVDNQGAIIVENGGSLVQIDDLSSFTGNNITVKRTTRPMKRSDYVYWGSPVQENVISQIPADFDKKFRWQAGASYNWFDLTTTTPAPGNGFITRVRNIAPYNVTATPLTFAFNGKPNNGIVTVPVLFVNSDQSNYGNYNLLSNPYPSAIDAEKFIDENNSLLTGTIHFWTSHSLYTLATQYNVMDYASWNSTGSSTPPSSDPDNEDLNPRGYIASGQGIFVQAKATGNVSFNNSMRQTQDNNQFFRMANPSLRSQAIATPEKHRLWLLLSNNSGAFRNMMVGYIEGATNSFEDKYDGVSFTSNTIDFYSVLKNKNLVIQGRALPFTASDVVDLGFKAPQAGVYKIEIKGADGMFSKGSFPVYIRDKDANNIVHNLRDGAYSFKTQAGTFNNRFELIYENEADLFDRNDTVATDVLVYGADKSVHISSKNLKIKSVELFDLLGKQVYTNSNVDANEFSAPSLRSHNTFLIVKTTLENNTVSTTKIIMQ